MSSKSSIHHKVKNILGLRPGDHIYRHESGYGLLGQFQHGIIYSIPTIARETTEEEFYQKTLVFEVTKEDGLVKTSLDKFHIRKKESIRFVKYNVSGWYYHTHVRESCYQENVLSFKQIKNNIDQLFEYLENDPKIKTKDKLYEYQASIMKYCMTNTKDDKMIAILEYCGIDLTGATTTIEEDFKIEKMEVNDDKNFGDIFDLKVGDHIYRPLRGSGSKIGHHHGIIYSVPTIDNITHNNRREMIDKILRETIVFEMTPDYGPCKSTLAHFKTEKNYKICKVIYGVSKVLTQVSQRAGTVQKYIKSPVNEILKRVDSILSQCSNNIAVNKSLYDMFVANCEQTVLFCTTGLVGDSLPNQITTLLGITKAAGKECYHVGALATSAVIEGVAKQGIKSLLAKTPGLERLAELSLKEIVKELKEIVKTAANNSASTATEALETGSKAIKVSSIAGVSIAAGAAVAVEGCFQLYRWKKKNNDFEYTNYDYKIDSIKGWSTTAVSTAVGCGLALVIGWWAILPTLAVLGVSGGVWYLWKQKYYKDFKQKWYLEYKIDENNIDSLEKGRKELQDTIKQEKLHPDWYNREILTRKEKMKRQQKYQIIDQIKTHIDEDIARLRGNNNNNNDDDDDDDDNQDHGMIKAIEFHTNK